MAKNGKKCKNPKNVQMRIDPYSSPVMLMIISDGQNRPKTRKNSLIWWGWVKISEKNTKNAISQKGLAKRFWKLVKFMSYMCTLRIKSKQTSCKEVRLDVVWGKCVYQLNRDWYWIPKQCWILETSTYKSNQLVIPEIFEWFGSHISLATVVFGVVF